MLADEVRVGTLNLASGRDATGSALDPAGLRGALAGVDVDVLAVQEVDSGQPRSHTSSQPAAVAAALGAVDWRFAPTMDGTPSPFPTWRPVDPPVLSGAGEDGTAPRYGIALVTRLPVRRWSVLGLGAGRGRLPVQAHDPRTGRLRWWWIPDEPRIAVAAELDGLTVVGTHLSFAPPTAVRQLLRLRRWIAGLPGPTVVAGDLNLPGGVPARLLGGRRLVRAATYPRAEPRVQLDHLLALGPLPASDGSARALSFGDHLLVTATVQV